MTVTFYNLTLTPSHFVSYEFIVVHFLADLYTDGKSTYVINDDDRITNVIANRKKFKIPQDAFTAFQAVHNDWEMNVCKKFPYEPLIGGIN